MEMRRSIPNNAGVFQGDINEKLPYAIEFSASNNNGSFTILSHGWTPFPGGPPLNQLDKVAPAGTQVQEGKAPPADQYAALIVDVDVPDGGSGFLRVAQEGAVLAQGAITGD